MSSTIWEIRDELLSSVTIFLAELLFIKRYVFYFLIARVVLFEFVF